MNTVTISVITICKNSEKTIEDTLRSVLNQIYPPFEYIIIDGESSDRTLFILDSYRVSFQEKNIIFKIISEKDNGIYDAMNKGIRNATGELIGILNSDDWYENNALSEVASNYRLNDNVGGVYYAFIRIWKNDLEYRTRQNHHNFLHENVTQHPTCFISKTVYQEYGIYQDKYKIAADYQLLNRLKNAGVPFFKIDKVITNFRIGGASSKLEYIGAHEYNEIKLDFGYISKKGYYLTKLKLYFNSGFAFIINALKK